MIGFIYVHVYAFTIKCAICSLSRARLIFSLMRKHEKGFGVFALILISNTKLFFSIISRGNESRQCAILCSGFRLVINRKSIQSNWECEALKCLVLTNSEFE